MSERQHDPKFEPLAGNSYNISPRFGEPKQAEGQYGTYWIFGILVDNKPYTWFLNEKTWKMVVSSEIKKGDTGRLDVVQQMGEKGPYNTFALHTKNGVVYSHDQQAAQPSADNAPDPYTDVPPPGFENTPQQPQPQSTRSEDNIYATMQECLLKACEMGEIMRTVSNQKDPLEGGDMYILTPEDIRSIAISMFIQMHR